MASARMPAVFGRTPGALEQELELSAARRLLGHPNRKPVLLIMTEASLGRAFIPERPQDKRADALHRSATDEMQNTFYSDPTYRRDRKTGDCFTLFCEYCSHPALPR